jgi:hypothetical protein
MEASGSMGKTGEEKLMKLLKTNLVLHFYFPMCIMHVFILLFWAARIITEQAVLPSYSPSRQVLPSYSKVQDKKHGIWG